MYVWWKEKKSVFLHKEKKNDFSFENLCTKDWLRDYTSWTPCGIEMKIKGILKFWFWISLHQGTLSILYSRIYGYMLSFMNEVDPWLLLLLCVLYGIQNQIFQQLLQAQADVSPGLKAFLEDQNNSPLFYNVFLFNNYVNLSLFIIS